MHMYKTCKLCHSELCELMEVHMTSWFDVMYTSGCLTPRTEAFDLLPSLCLSHQPLCRSPPYETSCPLLCSRWLPSNYVALLVRNIIQTFGIIKIVGYFFIHNRFDFFSHRWSGGIIPHMRDWDDNINFGDLCSRIWKENKYCFIRLVVDFNV